MNAALLAALLSVAPSSGAEPIARDLVENEHRRVGILPTVICRHGDHESTIGGLGPRGKLLARELQRELVAVSQQESYKAKFSVVQERAMLRAMRARGFGVGDLSESKKVRALAEEAGVDAIVALTYDEEATEPFSVLVNSETIDATDGTVSALHDIPDDLTLSKAAYQGQSWELRRWVDGRLDNRGMDLTGARPFGNGAKWEKTQYVHLKTDLAHPVEIEDFPYFFGVEVGGKLRVPETVERSSQRFYVVELNDSETYRVMLENRSDQPVYAALFIDGVSSIDQVMVDPADLETRRHWYLPARSGKRIISGWYNIPRDADGRPGPVQQCNEFQIVPVGAPAPIGEGFDDKIGMMTAVFYTVGMEGIEQPDPGLTPRSLPTSAFGTGLGKRKDVSLQFQTRPNRGLILASWTFYYRSREEIGELKSGGASQDPINFIAVPTASGDGAASGSLSDPF